MLSRLTKARFSYVKVRFCANKTNTPSKGKLYLHMSFKMCYALKCSDREFSFCELRRSEQAKDSFTLLIQNSFLYQNFKT